MAEWLSSKHIGFATGKMVAKGFHLEIISPMLHN